MQHSKCSRAIVSAAVSLATFFMAAAARAQTPGGAEASNQDHTWAFVHPPDAFRADALLDLRSMNEKVAGETGFVHLSADGESFVLGNGKPARFWCVGSDMFRKTPKEMDEQARFLAKLGVNMVRLHAQIGPQGAGKKIDEVNQKEIDGIWRMVAALKKQGIYATISPYWATGYDVTQWGIDGYTGKTDLWGLLFFEPKLQAAYKGWVKALFSPVNPYTGIALANDPAVAIIQVQNEDGLFFWTEQGIHPEAKKLLGRLFAQWLAKKYGSLAAAKAAWGGDETLADDPEGNYIDIMIVWQWTQPQTGGHARRLADQLEFFAQTQRDFYAGMETYYHKDLGCKQLINGSNWTTASPLLLNDVERYTNTANDVIAVNRYYTGFHQGPHDGWRIEPGDLFANKLGVLHPRDLPINLKQPVGHPMIITESTWVSPIDDQAEGPFLMAAYQSLCGIDGFYWFSAGATQYETQPYMTWAHINGQHPMAKWTCSTPALMGQFPAAALMFRMGYIAQGKPAVHEERPLADLWNRVEPRIAENASFDPNRNSGHEGAQSVVASGFDPLAFLVGPVEVKYGGQSDKTTSIDLTKYIDHGAKHVTSDTGQVKLDYGQGLCTIDAPSAQGASGQLAKAGVIALTDVTIHSANQWATVAVVAMDAKPLRDSARVLVQVGTDVRPTGWQQKAEDFHVGNNPAAYHGFRIENIGQMPWRIIDTDMTITLRNSAVRKAVLLDTSGYAASELPIARNGDTVTITLPKNAMYVVLE